MTTPPLKLKGDSESYLMGFVNGEYAPRSKETSIPAALGLYFNKDVNTCPYSFCYIGEAGRFMGHSSHIREDAPVDRAIIEAWYLFEVWPHYWQVCSTEETEAQISEPVLQVEYSKRLERFAQIVEEFKRREFAKALVFRDNTARFEASRLFYPTKPPRPNVPPMPPIP